MDKLDFTPPVNASNHGSGMFQDVGIIVAAIIGLVLLMVVWAKFLRKKRRSRSFMGEVDSSPATIARVRDESSGKARRRREHRPRNPTLAEKGGLPPVRPDVPPQAN